MHTSPCERLLISTKRPPSDYNLTQNILPFQLFTRFILAMACNSYYRPGLFILLGGCFKLPARNKLQRPQDGGSSRIRNTARQRVHVVSQRLTVQTGKSLKAESDQRDGAENKRLFPIQVCSKQKLRVVSFLESIFFVQSCINDWSMYKITICRVCFFFQMY